MPYDGEYAESRVIKRIAESPQVRDFLGACEVRPPEKVCEEDGPWITIERGTVPDLVLATDGSKHEYPVRNGYPGAEICCVTIAGVVIDIRRMRTLEASRPINPRDFRSIEKASSLERIFPGCNALW